VKIKRVLISQPAPPSDKKSPYFELAQKYGLEIDFRPFIEVRGISTADFRKQKLNILDHTAVIITSKTSVDNYFRLAEELRLTIPSSMKFFCMTESIAYYLQKYITFRKRKIFFGNGTFDDLLEQIKKNSTENFLLPVSTVHKPTIPNKLKKTGIKFSKAVMYETVSADLSDLREVNYDVLVFFSPSGIDSLVENFPDFVQNGTSIASFGPATAKAVKAAGLRLDVKAPTKESPSILMALENFIKDSKKK